MTPQSVHVEYALYALLGFVIIAMALALWASHKSDDYPKFKLIDLITAANGIASRPALMEGVAFVVMTWGFIVFMVRGTLSEWYAGLYIGAFVLRAAYSSFLNSKRTDLPPA